MGGSCDARCEILRCAQDDTLAVLAIEAARYADRSARLMIDSFVIVTVVEDTVGHSDLLAERRTSAWTGRSKPCAGTTWDAWQRVTAPDGGPAAGWRASSAIGLFH